MSVKLIGMGFSGYFKDKMNVFNSLVVVSSVIDILASYVVK